MLLGKVVTKATTAIQRVQSAQQNFVFAIDPTSGKLYEPSKIVDNKKTARYTVIYNVPPASAGEGPVTWAQLSETLSFFAQPDAPAPFLFVDNISTATSKPIWGDTETKGTDWTAYQTTCGIKDTLTNSNDYISVGDMVTYGLFDRIKNEKYGTLIADGNKKALVKLFTGIDSLDLLLFAHKKIVTFVKARQTMKLRHNYQTFVTGNVAVGSEDVPNMYVSIGTMASVYSNNISTAQCPVILKCFLEDRQASANIPFVYENWGFAMRFKNNFNGKIIRNSFDVNVQGTASVVPIASVNIVVDRLIQMLLNYGTSTRTSVATRYWTYARRFTLAKAICDSSAEPINTNYNSFCSCLGRKDVEAKLREVTESPDLQMKCISSSCQSNSPFIFKPEMNCGVSGACIPEENWNDISSAVTNVSRVCRNTESTSETALALAPASCANPRYSIARNSTGGPLFLLVLFIVIIAVIVVFFCNKNSS